MTALVARQPLHPMSMSSTQRAPRRLSTRLQDKGNEEHVTQTARQSVDGEKKQPVANTTNNKKRKMQYDEEDDGFAFTRVKKKKSRSSITKASHVGENENTAPEQTESLQTDVKVPTANGETSEPLKKQRNKMSFSTPNSTPKESNPIRRSKRISSETNQMSGSPQLKTRRKEEQRLNSPRRELQVEKQKQLPKGDLPLEANPPAVQPSVPVPEVDQERSGTKIALPFADTPVIRRNKAMREGKADDGKRRSSLGLRGRRASSLIESGSSNALPHQEVGIPDFYKHIESEGLPEPRRMRQLLTWCGTRSLDSKPMGTGFEDASARSAALVIQEELLKDLANRSNLSDWFTREELPVQPRVVPQRPNPQNIKNSEKILELEQQIQRLRSERDALEILLRPPEIPSVEVTPILLIDQSLLSESDRTYLESIETDTSLSADVSKRINQIRGGLGPNIDAFADGVHKICQYRQAADNMASRVLAICSEKLGQRERNSGIELLQQEGNNKTPRKALSSVLRGLSRIDR